MSEHSLKKKSYFHYFQTSIEGVELHDMFQFPFYYEPHPIAVIAVRELQDYLNTQNEWKHDFGEESTSDNYVVGKMFGVLVVKNQHGEIGYLCAVSGKLAGHNKHEKFVPPVFDILEDDGFFRKGELVISEINQRIAVMENHTDYQNAIAELDEAKQKSIDELANFKQYQSTQKQTRHAKRNELLTILDGRPLQEALRALDQESISEHYHLKQLKKKWKEKLDELEKNLNSLQDAINELKEERKNKSSALQDLIFDQFHFVNRKLEKRSVGDIFKHTKDGKPVAGAGECAAPKLFQYAFLNQMEPIALAEFWWGNSPKTEIRIQGQFYPACRGKCEPILGYMLQGMNVEENPLLKNPADGKNLSIVWEDPHIVIINKPHEFLSVPGKQIEDSVLTRLKSLYPQNPELMVVHRLDMSTSGILVAAKSMDVYKSLQEQFTNRQIKKRYVAVLNGLVTNDAGWIDLPIRVDLDDRPRQMVCFENGKQAQTRWKVLDRNEGLTRVHFFPVTGRTHQLRVHAAHLNGLNCPIVGDDLYGKRSTRLHLHAERIEFIHPVSQKKIEVEIPAEF